MISIFNHEKWTMTVKNNCITNDLKITLTDRWGIKVNSPFILLFEISQKEQKDAIALNSADTSRTVLQNKIIQVHAQNNPFAFSVYKHQGFIFVCFDKYGLSGGGRNEAIASGIVTTVAGAMMLAHPIGWIALGGNLVLSGGTAIGMYAYNADEKSYDNTECMKNAMYGIAGGIAGMGVGTALKAITLGGQMLGAGGQMLGSGGSTVANILTSSASNVTSTVTQKVLKEGKENISTADFAASAISGAIGAGVNLGVGALIAKGVSETADDLVSAVVINSLKEGTKSSATQIASTISSNIVQKKDVLEGVTEAAVIGMVTGCVVGGTRQYNDYKQKTSNEQTEKNKQIPNDSDELDETFNEIDETSENSKEASAQIDYQTFDDEIEAIARELLLESNSDDISDDIKKLFSLRKANPVSQTPNAQLSDLLNSDNATVGPTLDKMYRDLIKFRRDEELKYIKQAREATLTITDYNLRRLIQGAIAGAISGSSGGNPSSMALGAAIGAIVDAFNQSLENHYEVKDFLEKAREAALLREKSESRYAEQKNNALYHYEYNRSRGRIDETRNNTPAPNDGPRRRRY